MSIWTAVFFVVGIVALVLGAEVLVRGAARLAARTGLLGWLIVDAADHEVKDSYAVGILRFMVPLSVGTLVVIAVRERRST